MKKYNPLLIRIEVQIFSAYKNVPRWTDLLSFLTSRDYILCDWKKIREIADKHNLTVIEDSADTLGGRINNKLSGTYSDMSITSFYGSHIINCAGNGGALMLNDEKAISKAKLLRSWGRSSSLFDERSEAIENRFNKQF